MTSFLPLSEGFRIVAVFLLLLSACRPDYVAPQHDPKQYLAERDQALDDMRGTLGALSLRSHSQLGTPAAIDLENPFPLIHSASQAPTSAARDLLLHYRPLFGIGTADTLDFLSSATDSLSMRHIIFEQRHAGVSVWGSRLAAHLDIAGHLYRIDGHLFPLPMLQAADPTPEVSKGAIAQRALDAARAAHADASLSAHPASLYYLMHDEEMWLVYRLEVDGQVGSLPVHLAYFIDAHNGDVRAVEDLVAHLDPTIPATGSGRGALGDIRALSVSQRGATYYMQDPTRGDQRTAQVSPGEKLPGKTISSTKLDSWDDAADGDNPGLGSGLGVDVHAHLAALWDYFATHHGRYGWDGDRHGALAVVHLGESQNLALFDGDRLLFGDGDGLNYAPLGAALDIVAHEYAHAIARSSADLETSDGSGEVTLDEDLANLWACLIEQSLRPESANWTVGEEIYHPNGKPSPLVDLTDSHSVGPIAHGGYLLAQSLGVEHTAAIVYRALTVYLFRYANEADAVDGILAAARDLLGESGSQAVRANFAEGSP